jgi:hypothetical protein
MLQTLKLNNKKPKTSTFNKEESLVDLTPGRYLPKNFKQTSNDFCNFGAKILEILLTINVFFAANIIEGQCFNHKINKNNNFQCPAGA